MSDLFPIGMGHGLSVIGASKNTLCSSTFGQNIHIIKISARNLITDEKYNNKKNSTSTKFSGGAKILFLFKDKKSNKKEERLTLNRSFKGFDLFLTKLFFNTYL